MPGAAAKFVVGVGILGALAGVIAGALFLLSEEFVIANINCNPTENPAGAANCGTDNLVLDVDGSGKPCQIGKLGVLSSEFTPDCADGTVYEIPEEIDAFSGDPLNFPPLFPAQNNLANTLEDFAGQNLAFTDCDSFFGSSILDDAISGAAASGVSDNFDLIRSGLKVGYDAGIDSNVGKVDTVFEEAYLTVIGGANAVLGLSPFGVMPPLITDPYATQGNLTDGLEFIAGLSAPEDALLLLGLVAIVKAGAAVAPVDNTSVVIQHGVAFNTEYFPGVITGVSALGFWDVFGSPFLCPTDPTCTYLDFLLASNASALVTGQDRTDLEDLLALILNYEANLLIDPQTPATITDRAAIEAAVAGVRASTANPLDTAFVNLGVSKAAFIQNLKDSLPAEAMTPPNYFSPGAAQGTLNYALLCAGLGLSQLCSFRDIMNLISSNPLDPNQLALLFANSLLTTCISQGYTGGVTQDVCFTQTEITSVNVSGSLIIDSAAETLLGGLYGLPDDRTVADYKALAIAACKEDELDIAAIAQAQLLTPAGVGLVGGGLLLAVINLALFAGTSMGRWVGIISGLVSLVGVVLVLVALLGVYNAPIFGSVGGSGPIEDNTNKFTTGIGLIYAFVTIGGAAVGALLLLLGGFLLKPEEDASVAIMKPGA